MADATSTRMLTFRSGGWVLALAGILALVVFVWAVAGALTSTPLIGDGRSIESYGFELEPCSVPRELIVAGGLRKDALRALVDPPHMAGADVAGLNKAMRGKYLVSSDRVIGVSINGEARAYPLMVMKVHEIANDVVGGVPVAVTYNPLCDSVVVFDRRVAGAMAPGIDSPTLEFGVSGLIYNSNLLMYDRRPDAKGESLWSQLGAQAVAGPAAGTTLRVLPASLASWSDWLATHPGTTVIERDPRMLKRYKETKYASYFRSGTIMFPVAPLPSPDGPAAKQRIVSINTGSTVGTWTVAAIAREAGKDGLWQTRLGGQPVQFHVRAQLETVIVSPPMPAIYSFWFAWNAIGDPAGAVQ